MAAPRGGRSASRACPSRRAPTPAARLSQRRSRKFAKPTTRVRGGSASAGRGRRGGRASRRRSRAASPLTATPRARGSPPSAARSLSAASAGPALEVVELDRLAVAHAPAREPAQAVRALDPRGDERHAGFERDARRARCAPRPRASSAAPSGAACPRGTSRSRSPRARAATAVSIAVAVGPAAVHLERACTVMHRARAGTRRARPWP